MPFFAPRNLYCMFLGVVLAGCEAQLDLSGVDAQRSQATHRSDLFQAVARHQDTVITVGGMGALVQSTDSGGNWTRTTLPGKPFLIDITVCPDGGFHAIEKTDGLWSIQADGSWVRKTLPEMTEPQAMTCDSNNVIWVTGGFSTIIHSDDAGASWENWTIDEDLYLTTIQFVDESHGIVTGEFGTVLLTTDGGINWDRADDLPDSFYPQSTYFSSPETGWAVGLNGTIWATENGAQSWQQAPSGIESPLYGIRGFGDTLVAVGENTTILYRSPDHSTWHLLDGAVKSRTYLRGIISMGDNEFIAAGGGGALFTITVPQNEAGDSG